MHVSAKFKPRHAVQGKRTGQDGGFSPGQDGALGEASEAAAQEPEERQATRGRRRLGPHHRRRGLLRCQQGGQEVVQVGVACGEAQAGGQRVAQGRQPRDTLRPRRVGEDHLGR